MKLNKNFLITALFAVWTCSSCERIAVEEENEVPSGVITQGYGTAKLNVITRAGVDNSEDNVITDGRIYIFNSADKCVQILSINGETNQSTVQLTAGSYTLYAVGGDDLTRFTLPTQSEATPTSIIKLFDGKVMEDLLMASAEVTLEDGESLNQNLILKHKVMCVDAIEIRQVPLTVTKVEVTITSLYTSVQLNGDYLASSTNHYKIALEKDTDGDGKTWKATPNQMLFPSKGNPTIKVSVTTDEGTIGYAYNAAEEFPANHHITIIGTYKATQGVSLTGILTDGGWEEDRTITFDITDDNQTEPIAGEFFRGYYVVSVAEAKRTAVLLSQTQVDYVAPSGNATSAQWQQAFVGPMAALDKPVGASGNWRLPTKAEAELITKDPNAVTINSIASISIFCLDGNVLCWGEYRISDGLFHSGTTGFNSNVYLRPVIDITY